VSGTPFTVATTRAAPAVEVGGVGRPQDASGATDARERTTTSTAGVLKRCDLVKKRGGAAIMPPLLGISNRPGVGEDRPAAELR
jgi:hypothetical protein